MIIPAKGRQTQREGLRAAYLRHRYFWLFLLLAVAIGFGPMLTMVGFRDNTLEFLAAVALAMGVTDTRRGRHGVILLGLTLLFAIGIFATHLAELRQVSAIFRTLGFFLLVWVSGMILRRVLRPGRVDQERLFAALSVYLLLGVAFGLLFAAADAFRPGSVLDSLGVAGEPIGLDRAIYFSIITLTTTGFGDVAPGNEVTASFAMLEAIVGQAYTTVLVAWLVSLYVRDHGSK